MKLHMGGIGYGGNAFAHLPYCCRDGGARRGCWLLKLRGEGDDGR